MTICRSLGIIVRPSEEGEQNAVFMAQKKFPLQATGEDRARRIFMNLIVSCGFDFEG
jgi:hypothetical protein